MVANGSDANPEELPKGFPPNGSLPPPPPPIPKGSPDAKGSLLGVAYKIEKRAEIVN